MSECNSCARWVTSRKTIYADGSEVLNFQAAANKGLCEALGIETAEGFGCNKFMAGVDGCHVEVSQKTGSPWHHWGMIPCPDCRGKGTPNAGASDPQGHEMSSRACDRCAGTGNVRKYDDGFIGDERTRLHPKEREVAAKPKCPTCQREVNADWKACPVCATRLDAPAETEVVESSLS